MSRARRPTKVNGPRRTRRGSLVNLPWSDKGWYADEMRAKRSAELDALIQAEGHGKINPLGWYEERPITAVSPGTHNPYFNLFTAAWLGALGFILLGLMGTTSVWAWILAVFFWFACALGEVMTILRIPSWHRARRVAKNYVREHGGELPPELHLFN